MTKILSWPLKFLHILSYLPVLLMILFTGCKDQEALLGIKIDLIQKKLSNGLTVLLAEDHTVPIVAYQTWFRTGSVDERPGLTGISHLFEHLMFKGTKKYGPKEFFQRLESRGAEVNAFTTRDYTVYHEVFIPSLLPDVIEMEADRMQNLKLDQEILDNERLVVFEERRLRTENSPEGRMQEALWQLAFRYHPYQWPVIGYPHDLVRISAQDLKDFYSLHYQPKNATLVIVGDFKIPPLLALLKKYYEPIPGKPNPGRNVGVEPEQTSERRLVLFDQIASEKLSQAYPITSASQEDSYSLDILSNILFAGTASRAYQFLVEEKDVVLGVSGTAFTPTYPGLFLVNVTMKNNVPSLEAEKGIQFLIGKIQREGVSTEEIQKAVRQLTVQAMDGVRTAHGLGMLLGTVQMILGDPFKYAEDLVKYMKVTPADVKRVAKKYLDPNRRSVVLMQPKKPETDSTSKNAHKMKMEDSDAI